MGQPWISAGDLAYLLYPIVPLRWLIEAARLEGRVRAALNRRQRRCVRDNLAAAFGDQCSGEQLDRMSREFFEEDRVRALLIMLAPRIRPEKLEAMFPVEGAENLDRALEQGNGAILLGSHVNSIAMFLAITLLRRRGYPIGVALPEERDAWARTRFRKALDRIGGDRETVGEAIGGFYCQFNIRPIVDRLRKNEIVGQTGDGLHSARFVEAEFLGRKLPFTTGSASIAKLTGAAIVPIFQTGRASRVSGPDRMRFVLEEPFTVEKGDPADLEHKVSQWARLLEHHLRDNKPCWQHWLVPDLLETLADWPRRSLKERYELSHGGHER